MVFAGNPGTGKTMIANLVGKLLLALELIPSSEFRTVHLNEMKGKYMGQTPHEMEKTFQRPGVYFIDEAYAMQTRDDDCYGGEIAENRRKEVVIILAGYKEEMKRLFQLNPGLASRFPWTFDFVDYSVDDLVKIGLHAAALMKHTFTDDALEAFRTSIGSGLNARDVRNLVERIELC